LSYRSLVAAIAMAARFGFALAIAAGSASYRRTTSFAPLEHDHAGAFA